MDKILFLMMISKVGDLRKHALSMVETHSHNLSGGVTLSHTNKRSLLAGSDWNILLNTFLK
jgi:hypothetical protein